MKHISGKDVVKQTAVHTVPFYLILIIDQTKRSTKGIASQYLIKSACLDLDGCEEKGIIITHRQSTIYDGISSYCFFGQTTQGDFQCCTQTALQMDVPNSMSSFLTLPFHNEEGVKIHEMRGQGLSGWKLLTLCWIWLASDGINWSNVASIFSATRKINMIWPKMEQLLYGKVAETMPFVFLFSKCRLQKENIYLMEPFLPDKRITFTCNHLSKTTYQSAKCE